MATGGGPHTLHGIYPTLPLPPRAPPRAPPRTPPRAPPRAPPRTPPRAPPRITPRGTATCGWVPQVRMPGRPRGSGYVQVLEGVLDRLRASTIPKYSARLSDRRSPHRPKCTILTAPFMSDTSRPYVRCRFLRLHFGHGDVRSRDDLARSAKSLLTLLAGGESELPALLADVASSVELPDAPDRRADAVVRRVAGCFAERGAWRADYRLTGSAKHAAAA